MKLLNVFFGISVAIDSLDISERIEELRECARQAAEPSTYRDNGVLIVPDLCYEAEKGLFISNSC